MFGLRLFDGWNEASAKPNHNDRYRQLRVESLETRQMLSANSLLYAPADADSTAFEAPAQQRILEDSELGARDQKLAISAIHLLVGGEQVTVTSAAQVVEMNLGDSLEIVGIDYRLANGEILSGKIAFEGYLNKLDGSDLKTDYSDGRFGRHEQEGQIPGGNAKHSGLDGVWKMEAGTESLTLVLVRYGDDGSVTTEDRVTIRTQVGTPDFAMSSRILVRGEQGPVRAGDTTKIYGIWGNLGEGTYRNYAEVDIYHSSNPDKIVWSGALEKTLGGRQAVLGEFHNGPDSKFSERWIPVESGVYVLKFYTDPEKSWNESSETNNDNAVKIKVLDAKHQTRSVGRHVVDSAPADQAFIVTSAESDKSIVRHNETAPEQSANWSELKLKEAPVAAAEVASSREEKKSDETKNNGKTAESEESVVDSALQAIDKAFDLLG